MTTRRNRRSEGRDGDGSRRRGGRAQAPVELDALPPVFRLRRREAEIALAEPVNAAARHLALDADLQEALRRLADGALDSGRWRSGSIVDGAVTWVALVAPVGREVAQAVILPLSRAADPERLEGLAPGITPREREVLALSLRGRSPREIAADLGISWHTVRTHMKHAYRALGVSSRAEALAVVSDGEAPRVDVGLLGGDGARARATRGRGNGA